MTTSRRYPDRPLIGIGIVVLCANKVLLIRRGRPPGEGEWSLPGGAQKLGETAEQAARRELAEETGLAVGSLHLAGNVDSIHPDAEGGIQYHYTILDFCALYVSGTPRAGGDACDIIWADCENLDGYQLWDETIRIIRLSQRRLGLSGE